MQQNQRGFAHLGLVLVLGVLLVVAGVSYRVYANNKVTTQIGRANRTASAANQLNCSAARPGLFTHDVTYIDNINLIQTPIRLIGGSNIKTHSFIDVSQRSPVYTPMDATLNGGANYYETMGPNPVAKVQYILAFNDGCEVSFWLDHIVDVPDNIKAAFPADPRKDTQGVKVKSLRLKAGDLVGYTNQEGSARFDFGAVNLKGSRTSLTTNPRFKDNPIVATSDKYRFATCPYNLYDTVKQQVYRALYDPTANGDQEIIDTICQ